MWSRKSHVRKSVSASDIRIVMPEAALLTVFDECDSFTDDETGGRLIGRYTEARGKLTIEVTGIIEPGPNARRSRVSFFQDGPYQEGIFRQIEQQHPEIEHLGNWHTHHVNGLPHLSDGDLSTYTRTVNHKNHNTSFFYALLVIAKNPGGSGVDRYDLRHYVFRRGDDTFYEVPSASVRMVDTPLVWPAQTSMAESNGARREPQHVDPRPERIADRDSLGELYNGFRSFTSQKLGFYWRGQLVLVDGTEQEVLLIEDPAAKRTAYTVALREPHEALKHAAEDLAKHDFPSARIALVTAERTLNRTLFEQIGGGRVAQE
jgi:hypothetical protein